MQLMVNTESPIWGYKYVIEEKFKKLDWFTMKTETKEEKFAKWVLLNIECRGLLNCAAKSTANDCDLEEIIQESYLSFIEICEKDFKGKENREKFKSHYFNNVKSKVCKNNMYSSNIDSEILSESKYKAHGLYIYNMIMENNEKKLNDTPFKENKIELIKDILTEEEYDELLIHFSLGKTTSMTKSGMTSDGYYQKMKYKLNKYKGMIECEKNRR